MTTRLKDRREGGRLLAGPLAVYAGVKDVLVLAIPSGGAPVAAALARALGCPMDVLVVRTLNVPQHDPWEPEIVMGAVAPGGVRVLDFEVLTSAKVQPQELEQVTAFEQRELDRLQRLYRGDRPFPELRGRSVILAADAIVIEVSAEDYSFRLKRGVAAFQQSRHVVGTGAAAFAQGSCHRRVFVRHRPAFPMLPAPRESGGRNQRRTHRDGSP